MVQMQSNTGIGCSHDGPGSQVGGHRATESVCVSVFRVTRCALNAPFNFFRQVSVVQLVFYGAAVPVDFLLCMVTVATARRLARHNVRSDQKPRGSPLFFVIFQTNGVFEKRRASRRTSLC